MAFVVESGIPPVVNRKGRKPTPFPLIEMDVGDSFLIACDPTNKKETENWRRKFMVAKKAFLEKYEAKFQTATVSDGIRVWRTE